MGVRGQPVEGNVEEGIVVARLMRDRDVDAHAVVQEGVRRVPVIIAEVPARVLAQDDHKARPEQQRPGRKTHIRGPSGGRARVMGGLADTWALPRFF